MTLLLALSLLGLGTSSPVEAWDRIAPGIEYRFERRSSPAQRIHIARVDLRSPHIGVRATREGHRGRVVSSFARLYGASLAINGGFFAGGSHGLAMADGALWSSDQGNLVSYLAAGADNRIDYDPGGDAIRDRDLPSWYRQAVNGRPLLVWEGANVAPTDCPRSLDLCRARHPRTATGVSRNGRWLHFVVVDGRRSDAAGMTTRELGRLMVDLGAWTALNHDGGGSSTMWLRGRGVVNRPSDGRERVVSNHVGIVSMDPFCRGRLRGRVRDVGGGPLSGAQIVVEGSEATRRVTTSDDGRWELPRVECGILAVTATLDGFESRTREAHVVPVTWTARNLRLRRADEPEPPPGEPSLDDLAAGDDAADVEDDWADVEDDWADAEPDGSSTPEPVSSPRAPPEAMASGAPPPGAGSGCSASPGSGAAGPPAMWLLLWLALRRRSNGQAPPIGR
jgi:hypothetical protein